ncbi:unnamed protein product [Toxocara canis]|uniref:EGF-like domain protein n=1 Tax=Toxocara canis TaxID=6265 RepID=A0A183UR19_TOXCA|nr:unnamed protein product [Toxocara canis]
MAAVGEKAPNRTFRALQEKFLRFCSQFCFRNAGCQSESHTPDVDECQLSDFYCGEKGVCKNLVGSYACTCAEGYQQQVQGGRCVDIDECKYDPCDKAALCTNLQGSFKCSCIDGFIGNGIECHETIMYPMENPTLVLQSTPNSIGDLELETPIKLFGKTYKKIYISSNGAVSFGSPLQILDRNPPRFPAFVPLYQQYDVDRGGNIYVKIINENDATDYVLLTRSSLNVQSKFHQNDFKTRSMLIISFEKLLQAETDRANTFQVVISQGDNATFLTYLFEEAECETAVSGFSSGREFFELPFELLTNRSNIGEKGKWMFRIDGKSPIRCPAGTLEPPFCQKECSAGSWGFGCENSCHCRNDIPCDFATGFCSNAQCADGWTGINCFEDVDECLTETHQCSPKAKCINTIGSYTCECNQFYTGDGFICEQVDACYRRLNEKCSINAVCDDGGPEGPECICNEGFHGDGLNCFRIEKPSERPTLSDHENTITEGSIAIPGSVGHEEEFEETPFMMHNWVTEQPYLKSTPMIPKKRPATPDTPVAKDYSDIEDEVYVGGRTLEESDVGSMWFIIVPIALCGIWAILIAVIVAVCCRKKRRSSKLNFKEPMGMTGWTSRNTRPFSSHFAQY